MRHAKAICATLVAVGAISIGGVVVAQSGSDNVTFGTVPNEESRNGTPDYSAVSDHDGNIAGYVHTETFESGGVDHLNPSEALEYAATTAGTIYEVFSTEGELVGYFATGIHGFIDNEQKDALVLEGFQLATAPWPGNADDTQDSVGSGGGSSSSSPSTSVPG